MLKSHHGISRRVFLGAFVSFAAYCGLRHILDAIQSRGLLETKRTVYDGSKTVTVIFSSDQNLSREVFINKSMAWHDGDAFRKLCRAHNVQNVFTEFKGNTYLLNIAFANVDDMKSFVQKSKSLNVYNSDLRKKMGITAEVVYRV